MVGDADAIKPAAAMEIYDLGKRQAAVGVTGVDVEVAKLNAGRLGNSRAGGAVAAGALFEGVQRPRGAGGVAGLVEHQFGQAQRGVGPAQPVKSGPPGLPLAAAMGKGVADWLGEGLAVFRHGPDFEDFQEPGITLFLSGDDGVDDPWASGRQWPCASCGPPRCGYRQGQPSGEDGSVPGRGRSIVGDPAFAGDELAAAGGGFAARGHHDQGQKHHDTNL